VTDTKGGEKISEPFPEIPPFDYPERIPLMADHDLKGLHGNNWVEYTDAWNADHFIERYQGVVRYCNPLKRYFIWNGLFWAPDKYGEVKRLCQDQISDMLSDHTARSDTGLMKHLVKSLSANGIRNMMFFLESNRISVYEEQLDADRDRINTLNCVINLETVKPEKPSIDRYLTRQLNTQYNPNALCPEWLNHLTLIFDRDQETIDSFQMIAGYSLLYFNPEQLFFIHHGEGQNGKSVTMKVLKAIWGDYAKSAEYRTFLQKKNDEAVRTDIARLYSAHLVLAVEGKENGHLNEQLIKWITGGDDIVSRGLYQQEQERPIYAKIHLVTNPKPVICDTSYAMLRRIIMIPYLVKIPENKRDGRMEERLLAEKEGIFLWCLQGLREWHYNDKHLKLSTVITNATEAFKQAIDGDREFFTDDIEITGDIKDTILKKKLFEYYQQWYSDKHGEYPPIKLRVFNKICEAHQITKDQRVATGYIWIGIKHLTPIDKERRKKDEEEHQKKRKSAAMEIALAIKKSREAGVELPDYISADNEPMNFDEPSLESPSIRAREEELPEVVHFGSLVHNSEVSGFECSSSCGESERSKCISDPSKCGRGIRA